MNTSLFFPINKFELLINLSTLILFSRKVEMIYGSRYILIPYLICSLVTFISFMPCNMDSRINRSHSNFNPNALNFTLSQIIFMKYRLKYLNTNFLSLCFLGTFIFLILPESYTYHNENRNILLSALLTSIAI
jgi:hypothetical protein